MVELTKHYDVDEAFVTITYRADQRTVIVLQVKDPEVIAPLDLENKKKMADITKILAANLISLVGNTNFSKGPVRQQMVSGPPPADCPKCGTKLNYEKPCSGCGSGKIVCPSCNWKANVRGVPAWAQSGD